MKRALKKREKTVLTNTPSSDDSPVEQLSVNNTKFSRRATTQAAMIGLAISVGATSLLVTRQSDQAQAAAPVGSQKAASTFSNVAETEIKFAATKLESQAVSSASVPENSVVVEPTAVSQVPGLEAKLQIATSNQAVQVPASATFSGATAENKSVYLPSPATSGVSSNISTQSPIDNQLPEKIQSTPDAKEQAEATPVTVPTQETAKNDVDEQLKAQQEFALNRLQQKSNRLRSSLSELRSEETKNLSPNTISAVQPTTVVETEKQESIQAESTADTKQPELALKLKPSKQPDVVVQPLPQPVAAKTTIVASSTTTAYEVKPGDTLAAIARKHGTSVSELVKVNNLSDPNQIQISQNLVIPTPQAAQPTSTPVPELELNNSPKTVPLTVNRATLNEKLPVTTAQLPLAAPSQSVIIPTPLVTEDSLSTIPTSDNSFGVGGDSPVPVAINVPKPRQNTTANTKSSDRLRNLQAEIQRLRAKYRTQQSGVAVPTEEATEITPTAIPVVNREEVAGVKNNPEPTAIQIPVPRPVGPSNAEPVKPLFSITRPTNEPINPQFITNQESPGWNAARQPSSVRLNVPSANTDTDSLGRLRGTTVSPKMQSLPPLAAVDQYLPKPIDDTIAPPSNSSSVSYMWPAKGVLTSGYGWRWGRMHRGIDIANSTGTPIYAAAHGIVEKAGWNKGGYGNLVDIRHPDGSLTRYAHNSRIMVQAGQYVEKGQQIAAMGSTGFSTGPHSHFEIHAAGKGAVNPVALLPNRV